MDVTESRWPYLSELPSKGKWLASLKEGRRGAELRDTRPGRALVRAVEFGFEFETDGDILVTRSLLDEFEDRSRFDLLLTGRRPTSSMSMLTV